MAAILFFCRSFARRTRSILVPNERSFRALQHCQSYLSSISNGFYANEEKHAKKCIKFLVHFGRNFSENWHCGFGIWPPYGHAAAIRLRDSQTPVEKSLPDLSGEVRPIGHPSKSFFVHRAAPPVATLPTFETWRAPRRDDAAQKISSRSVARSARYSTRKFDGFCGATWRPVDVLRPFLRRCSPRQDAQTVQIWRRFTMPFRRNSNPKGFPMFRIGRHGLRKSSINGVGSWTPPHFACSESYIGSWEWCTMPAKFHQDRSHGPGDMRLESMTLLGKWIFVAKI